MQGKQGQDGIPENKSNTIHLNRNTLTFHAVKVKQKSVLSIMADIPRTDKTMEYTL